MMALLALSIVLLSSLHIAAAEQCFNAPNGNSGECLNIHQCPPILQLLKQKPLRPETVRELQNAQCGFDGTTPKVCCPSNGPAPPVTSVVTPPTPPPTVPSGGGLPGPPVGAGAAPTPVAQNHPKVRQLLPMNNCGISVIDRIVNGKPTALGQLPWMARLGYQTRVGESYRCGGSLISRRYVLTAAHCISHLPNSLRLSSVQLGEWDALTEPDCELQTGFQVCMPASQKFGIERSTPHPQYSPTSVQNDIGLVRLNRDADTSVDNVQPICLPVGRLQLKNLDPVKSFTVSGWGTTENGSASNMLLHVKIPPVPNERCKSIYQRQAVITPTQICAGGETQDSCDGDSGGPLFMHDQVNNEPRNVQVGIVSFGPVRCGTRNQPGVYTRVGHYMAWLLDNMF